MRYNALGESGIDASVIGLGTWAIGGWMWGGTDERRSMRAIHAALDHGVNLIDTAPVYGFGLSEEIVGKAIHDRRDRVILATKFGLVWHHKTERHHFNSTYDVVDPNSTELEVYRSLTPQTIRYEIDLSLFRLRTDYIDLYQAHWQESPARTEDAMAALLHLREQGKIRSIGLCNVTPPQMAAYRAQGIVAADQERYSMLDRNLEATNLPYCHEHNIAFLAYSPLSQGLLTGKIDMGRTFGEGDQRGMAQRFSKASRQQIAAMLADLVPIADKHEVTMAQLAIAWAIHQPGCTHALVGARDTEQVIENAGAADIQLSPRELVQIDSVMATFQEAPE
ncbi:MAG: aldo/keto reductase [Verrucomicrobia bacterium]|nr:aldo/keto reductase [Verrucomicrobiota bacterium]MDA1086664.1 aldo/keto reductase [Verrucomicrobiota bacterium]